MNIPFNKPYTTGNEIENIQKAIDNYHLSGNGPFTKKCQSLLEERYKFNKCLLTTSCTDALEMAAMLSKIRPGDEVIVPSFTFVSTALAFVREGAIIKFIDSRPDHPGMDETTIESLITKKTKAIVPVHYAGVACDMDKIMDLAEKYNLFVIEDAAHSIDSFYKGIPLGSIGHFGCFSFHATKNIHCGEGGMITINHSSFNERAEILWEKGTNRAEFFRGESRSYEWKDTGSSFLLSELNASFLNAQIDSLEEIQTKRKKLWTDYFEGFKYLSNKGYVSTPVIPDYATLNANSFYLTCRNRDERNNLINYLKRNGIIAISHFLPLHKSKYFSSLHDGRLLKKCDFFSETLVRFPLFPDLKKEETDYIIEKTLEFFKRI
jgi:dTDP-4-amino-4,6-dideoxygalactose transaminase